MPAVITATGTSGPVEDAPSVQGQSIHQLNGGGLDFDHANGLRAGTNLFQEVTQFVGIVAAALGVPSGAAAGRVMECLAAIRRNPIAFDRVFTP